MRPPSPKPKKMAVPKMLNKTTNTSSAAKSNILTKCIPKQGVCADTGCIAQQTINRLISLIELTNHLGTLGIAAIPNRTYRDLKIIMAKIAESIKCERLDQRVIDSAFRVKRKSPDSTPSATILISSTATREFQAKKALLQPLWVCR